jgi:glycosyltransferase involved in cell wall biosynthesis
VPIEFVWKGISPDSLFLKQIELELRKLGLEKKITFLEQNNDTASFFMQIDLFLSLSREDPYPLVVLEAARYKIPSLCFEESGGAPEFVEKDAGSVIPFLNLNRLSEEIIMYFHNEKLRKEKGERAYTKWREKHGNKTFIKDSFLSILEKL